LNLIKGTQILGTRLPRCLNFHVVAPNICGSLVWNFLYITLLTPRILRWLQHLWEISEPFGLIEWPFYPFLQYITCVWCLYTQTLFNSKVLFGENIHAISVCNIFYVLRFMYVVTLKNFNNTLRKFDILHDLHMVCLSNMAVFPVG
jgi:hypothetical protein